MRRASRGGCCSAASSACSSCSAITYGGSRIGDAATVGILIAGQLVMGAAIDRFGLFGSKQIALHWPRLIGIVLLGAGAALSLRK